VVVVISFVRQVVGDRMRNRILVMAHRPCNSEKTSSFVVPVWVSELSSGPSCWTGRFLLEQRSDLARCLLALNLPPIEIDDRVVNGTHLYVVR
jgi:hypothetical protein